MAVKKDWYDQVLVVMATLTFILLILLSMTKKPINVFNMCVLLLLFTNLYFLLKFHGWLKY